MTGAVALTPSVQAIRHLASLHGNEPLPEGEYVLIRGLDGRSQPARVRAQHYFVTVKEAARYALAISRWLDTYVGVGTRGCPLGLPIWRCPCKPRGKTHVRHLGAVWV